MFFKYNYYKRNSRKILKHLYKVHKYNSNECIIPSYSTKEDQENLKKEVQEFFKQYFGELNFDIKYLYPSQFEVIEDNFINSNIFNEDQVTNFLANSHKVVNLFDVDIFFTDVLYESRVRSISTHEGQYFFDDVTLSKVSISNLQSTYVHELGHMLASKNIYNVADTTNDEFISIFLEYLYLHEDSEEFLNCETNRWLNVANTNKGIKADIYYTGNTYALFLYYIYRNSTPYVQKEILKDFKTVITGENSVQSFLTTYNLDMSNSDIVKPTLDSINRSKQRLKK
ncbi:MAG: hypothetical protein R3Y13_04400 [bacterium]